MEKLEYAHDSFASGYLPTSISNQGLIHSRTISGASTFEITEVQEPSETKVQGLIVCECCPKKPKRSKTLAELIAHEAVLLLEKTGSKVNEQAKPQTRPPDSERRTRNSTRSSNAGGGTGSIRPGKDESAQGQLRGPVTPDDFQNADKTCPFLLYKPDRILPAWEACFGLKKEISHIVAHIATHHGLIHGTHPDYSPRVWRYLASCCSCDNFSNEKGNCEQCSSLHTWKDEDFDDQSHHGVVLCLRCYGKFGKKEMQNHMTGPQCRSNMDKPKEEKLYILYTTFCSYTKKSTTIFTNPSPRTSTSDHGSMYSRNISGKSTYNTTEVQEPSETKVQGLIVCECCPKKPKRFKTLEELNTHEAEKPHKCAFCGYCFKYEGDAQRHQNSLHVRRYSWSCSALSGYDMAFHDSTEMPGEADTCGYCGDDFPRSGGGTDTGVSISSNVLRQVTEHDQIKRLRHLEEVHNFKTATPSRSSLERIISDSTSGVSTQGQVGNGPTCL